MVFGKLMVIKIVQCGVMETPDVQNTDRRIDQIRGRRLTALDADGMRSE